MSMLDSFFNKGFKGTKCKTLLKLTIPRIKLLRNRREIQIKQMRRDIAKLLETGQEATARIRVEHIIREENMMAAQEVLELFCELIAVRLPIIETQRECPLDLKEAISSVCFAAPRCADLPELIQVQMLFGQKYGKEFISAATELMPDCGVNRQLIELLSIRAPSPEKKLRLLKEIAEEHEVDWDPAASETEFLKSREDLLNGPSQFVSGSKLPLPEEKHDDSLNSASYCPQNEENDSDSGLDSLDFPEVPKAPLRPTANNASAPEVIRQHPVPTVLHPNIDHDSSSYFSTSENEPQVRQLQHEEVSEDNKAAIKDEMPTAVVGAKEEKQFIPFISPPSQPSTTFASQSISPPSINRKKSDAAVDFQDVLAAAQAAAETAERAAAAARSAATIAQARISELTKKNSDQFPEIRENPFHADISDQPVTSEKRHFDSQDTFSDTNGASNQYHEDQRVSESPELPSVDKLRIEHDSPPSDYMNEGSIHHQPQRLPSMDDESYFSYPNLFGKQNSNVGSGAHTVSENSRSADEH